MGELVSIVTGGVPVNVVTTGANLERALQHGNHRSVTGRQNGRKLGKMKDIKKVK